MKTTARDTTARFWFAVAVACALQTTFAQRLLTDEEVGIVSPPHRDSTNSATPAIESTAQAMQQAKTDEFGGVAVDPVPGSAAPASQPAHPTATAGAEQDWVPTVILATLVGGVVLLVLWQLLLYFSRSSRGRSPPGSLPHVIEAVSPSHTVHLHPSRLKDSSPAVLGEQLHVGIDAAPLCLPAASLPVYFILHNNEPEGPYTIEDLRSLWNSGAVTGETFYCEEGDEAWLHLEAVADRLQSSPVGRTSVAETHTNLSPLITPPPLPSAAGQQKPDSQRWTCRLNGVPPAASAPLPLTESREIVSPAGQRTTADCYTTSNCRFCGGSIEFPEHGLGEWVDCPHCGRQLQLRNMGTTERFLVGVRVWCRERSFNWKWASALIAVVLVCGTALFIYASLKTRSAERAKRQTEMENARNYQLEEQAAELRRQAAELRLANQIAEAAQRNARWDEISADFQRSAERAKRQTEMENARNYQLEEQAAELRRQAAELRLANQIAEAAQRNARWDEISADFQRRKDKLDEDIARSQAASKRRMAALRDPMQDMPRPAYSPSFPNPQVGVPSTSIGRGSYDPNSLANPYGAGSPYKPDGLMNPYSQFGSQYSSKSWRNPYATDAPKLYDSQGNYRGRLSANPFDPDSTSNPYGRFGSPYSAESINNPYGLGSPYRSDPVYVVPSR